MRRAVWLGVAVAVVVAASGARADDGGTPAGLGLGPPTVPAFDLPPAARAVPAAPSPAAPSPAAPSPAATSPAAPAPGPADKSRYTVFNPVPTDLLREMVTNRPSATDTPQTIDAGHVQVEAGVVDYTYVRTRAGRVNVRADSFAFGDVNVRLGVLNRLEANVVVDAFELDRTHDANANTTAHANGFADTSAGFKLNLWGDDGADEAGSTALAVEPQFKFPTARGGVGNGRFEFAVNVPLSIDLPGNFHLTTQASPSHLRDTAGTGYVTGVGLAATLDRVVVGNVDVFAEYSANTTTERHVKVPQFANVGATYPVTDNVTVDAAVSFGLNRASADVGATTGVSVRF